MVSISRRLLLDSLKGQRIHIPDLHVLFQHWPISINKELERLRFDVDRKLQDFLPGMMAKVDAEVGPLASDIQKAHSFRAETIPYVKDCLGISEKVPGVCPSSSIIRSFMAVSEEVCKVYNEEQRSTLVDEIAFFMRTSATEQKARLAPEMPSLPDYIECRMGTSAVGVTCGIIEYAYEKALPSVVMKDPDMKVLWAQVNIIVWVVNDLLSIKKEIAQDTVDSLIPLLYLKHGNVQDAIEIAVSGLEAEIRNFDEISGKLQARYSYDPTTQKALSTFIKACQFNCTGNLHWR
ncbi:MAG: hypothetical protein Q9157_002863 [Trypethelium eluteriae]